MKWFIIFMMLLMPMTASAWFTVPENPDQCLSITAQFENGNQDYPLFMDLSDLGTYKRFNLWRIQSTLPLNKYMSLSGQYEYNRERLTSMLESPKYLDFRGWRTSIALTIYIH